MYKALAVALAAAASTFAVVPSADARQGCGAGGHRNYNGRCVANRGRVVAGPRIGIFYSGRGYWDGRRYWGHRYRYRGGWRYR